jgi:hypothetical protein
MHPQAAALMRRNVALAPVDAPPVRRVALLRTETVGRNIDNIDALRPILEEHGFEFLETALMPFVQQAAAFRGAAAIAAVLGSAMTGLIFSPPGVKVLSLAPEAFGDRFFYGLTQQRHGRFVDLRGQVSRLHESQPRNSGFHVEPKIVREGLQVLFPSGRRSRPGGDASPDPEPDPAGTTSPPSNRNPVRTVPSHMSPGPLTRAQLVSTILATIGGARYLEVGVSRGATFFAVPCEAKVAVDPYFQFDIVAASAEHPNSTFHSLTSDAYFGGSIEGPFDAIFLDGLHTGDQIIRDFLNATRHLAQGGVILVDDVRPNSYLSSLPDQAKSMRSKQALGDPDNSWMGDVFRVIPFIQSYCQAFSYATPLEQSNVLVIWPTSRPAGELVARRLAEVAAFTYEDTVLHPEIYHPMGVVEICALIAASRV